MRNLIAVLVVVTKVISGFILDAKSPRHHEQSRTNRRSSQAAELINSESSLVGTPPTSPVDAHESSVISLETTKIGSVRFIIPQLERNQQRDSKFGSAAPVERPTIIEAATQLAKKCFWFADGRIDASIVPVPEESSSTNSDIRQRLLETDVLIALCLHEDSDLDFCYSLYEERRLRNSCKTKDYHQCQFAIDCGRELPLFVGSYDEKNLNLQSKLLPWTKAATSRRLAAQMSGLFQKWSSDEFVFGILIFLNECSGYSIDWVKHSIDATWEKGPIRNARELYTMVSKCGDCITTCMKDDTCRECLSMLTKVDTRDQVASYRTIVSYESDMLRDFSFCILQKNNIFECDASIPQLPQVQPLANFRGQPLTQEIARALLVGHLDDNSAILEGSQKRDVSWIVACGANEAYDKFPSQNQLFYPTAKGDGRLWYDPVFRVETLDGRHVWCKRHYGVRPQKVPGTFRFSVLDNGITSDEFWTIVAVADDLSWIVFHYAGAAAAVGQRYLGGLLCTPDGQLPDEEKRPQVWEAFRSAGIEPWELYCVDNRKHSPGAIAAGPPPLDFFRRQVLAKQVENKGS